jgi:predicted LPLAT superfamily acyltransferase
MTSAWRNRSERGSGRLKSLIIWLAVHFGRSFCRVLLVPICAYFLVTAPRARRASREFLTRAAGRRASWRDSYRHLFVFATTLLDRVFLLRDGHGDLEISVTGAGVFEEAIAAGRGCLLFGSHLGSFEMLGAAGAARGFAVNMVMHLEESTGLRDLLARTGRAFSYNVIALGRPDSMLRVKECLDRGEVVGILADRVYGGEATRSLPFLGSPARISLSPFRLARITGAPVVTAFGIFHGGRRYQVRFEALETREPAQYLEILERHARLFPYNWFNFYDFWSA